MMNRLEAAARQALEALEKIGLRGWVERKEAAITALREALAERQAAEPVAWANPNDLQNFDMKVRTNGGPLHTVPLCLCNQTPAQQAAEPVIEVEISSMSTGGTTATVWSHCLPVGTHKLYTHPAPTQQPLTDEQIKALASALEAKGDTLRQFARAVEAAHGITSKEGGAA